MKTSQLQTNLLKFDLTLKFRCDFVRSSKFQKTKMQKLFFCCCCRYRSKYFPTRYEKRFSIIWYMYLNSNNLSHSVREHVIKPNVLEKCSSRDKTVKIILWKKQIRFAAELKIRQFQTKDIVTQQEVNSSSHGNRRRQSNLNHCSLFLKD